MFTYGQAAAHYFVVERHYFVVRMLIAIQYLLLALFVLSAR